MKVIRCRIEGDADLIMHQFPEDRPGLHRPRQILTPEEQAEQAAFRDPEQGDQLYIPGRWVQSMLRAAGERYGKRFRSIVPAAVQVLSDYLYLVEPMDSQKPVRTYDVDARSVLVSRTRERVMRYRPRIEGWATEIPLRINDRILSVDDIKKLMIRGGERIGLGEMRPQLGGPFGIFALTEWDEI